ncbi:putative tetratricopeptide-like helical domain superfamily, Thioredoxin-like superfamily [Helianthus annuus]|uniref:Putative tetratricopeptide repeat (TPR)-containing protein n=1 Tax=Helianthus annuus TaxID=4232 RepID=A0A251SUG0_HELAN|nr:uncharacterized protein LOC110899092 [Helianthus annuus]XP_022001661.1 uncharacterized protein LOC110899092 [Helianthus annuus]KAF5774083.1 putative tetratricopeptide-like helical domain superfamily, acetyltransferase A, auxiliary subunit [Helianthus annuus]KAJ0477479.1 putative tetratricopeptide-like helical domain superfamily, Thioredoxin-like superfamily [Helianthus annuus]KAJ0481956.1 putative tetratricopeptide-like helical domain superfamily, Thioredoxin-like superfamily [Helianthus ann
MTGGITLIQFPTVHHSFPPPPISATNKRISAASSPPTEIRVCTNRTCRRQGSTEILQVLTGIAPPTISVTSCGCLGRCGSGPNLVVLPSETFVSHCATAARAADVMGSVCGVDSVRCKKSLEALAVRKKGEAEMERGEFVTAEMLLSQAIDLNPIGGLHYIYKSRSVARLAMNKTTAALEDAIEASTIAPKYPEAYVCKGDALMAVEKYEAAADSFSTALELDPSIRRSKSFKARIAKLQEKLATTNC